MRTSGDRRRPEKLAGAQNDVTAGRDRHLLTNNEERKMEKPAEYKQTDMFPVEPEISSIGIVKFETKGAEVIAVLAGVTNVNDVAMLTEHCWQKAVAEWLLNLHGGDAESARRTLNTVMLKLEAAAEAEQKETAKAA